MQGTQRPPRIAHLPAQACHILYGWFGRLRESPLYHAAAHLCRMLCSLLRMARLATVVWTHGSNTNRIIRTGSGGGVQTRSQILGGGNRILG